MRNIRIMRLTGETENGLRLFWFPVIDITDMRCFLNPLIPKCQPHFMLTHSIVPKLWQYNLYTKYRGNAVLQPLQGPEHGNSITGLAS